MGKIWQDLVFSLGQEGLFHPCFMQLCILLFLVLILQDVSADVTGKGTILHLPLISFSFFDVHHPLQHSV